MQTCDYPKRTYSPSVSPEPQLQQKSKKNATARKANKTPEAETEPGLYTRRTRSRKVVINSKEENFQENDQEYGHESRHESGQDNAQEHHENSGQENEDNIEDEYFRSNSEDEDYYYVERLDSEDEGYAPENNDDSVDGYIKENHTASVENIPKPSKNTRKRNPDNDLIEESITRRKKSTRICSLSQPTATNTRKRK